MMAVPLNYTAIFVAFVVSMIIGAIWYARPVFGNSWVAMIGLSEEQMKKSCAAAMTRCALLTLLMIYVTAHFVAYSAAETAMDGAMTGLWLWLGFVGPVFFIAHGFENRPVKLTLINSGHHLASLLAAGAILAGMR